ncbi:MAG: LysR family transcriptional regulator [Bilophila wadsworthia]
MELRVLRYFLAVAREGSVTGAANFLHVTQPTLSRQIKELEEELGTKLFVRHSHSVSLTPDGMRLRKRAEEVVDMIEKTEAEFAVKEESVEGDVHIGAGETRVMRHVAEVIHELRKDYPNIHIHLYSGNLEDVAERLDKGLLDFGVLIQPADLSKYDYVNLPEKDVWGVVTRKDSPLAARQAITRQDLLGEPLILSRQAIRRTSTKMNSSSGSRTILKSWMWWRRSTLSITQPSSPKAGWAMSSLWTGWSTLRNTVTCVSAFWSPGWSRG